MTPRSPGPIYRSPREKFLRSIEADREKAERHSVRVRFDGRYRAVCSCAWVGLIQDERDLAVSDGDAHRHEHLRDTIGA